MNNENGFIVLRRKMLEWEWYSDPKTVTVWLYLLLRANWKPNRWRGIEIGRGQTLETYPKIAKATGLSVQSVRTALFHLKSTGEITTESTGYGTLISITQYSKYQDLSDDINRQINRQINTLSTDDQQTINSTRTNITKKQSNNIVCEEYISNTESNQKHSSPPTLADIESFVYENGLVVDPKYFFDYYESAGWKSDWKARLRRWDKEDREKKQTQTSSLQTDAIVPMPSYMQKQKEEMLQQDEPKEKKRIVIDDWENLW